MSDPTPQSTEPGTLHRVQTTEGVSYEKIPAKEPTGTAYVEPPRAKSTRELEMEAGKRAVAAAAELVRNRPPRVISEAEARAQGSNTPVFRPNMLGVDNMTKGLGPLLRKVGGKVPQAVA